MHGFKSLITLATIGAFLALSTAAPTSNEVETVEIAQSNSAVITMFAGDTCSGGNQQFVETSGDHCIRVPFAVRSIHLDGA